MMFSVPPPLTLRRAVLFALAAAGCFHLAYTVPFLGWLIFPYVLCLSQLARLPNTRDVLLISLLTGLLCIAPPLAFFYGIFGAPAFTLWTILAAWTAAFVVLLHLALRQTGPVAAALLLPFLWTGLEYFRSELYFLRFSWLNVGDALGLLTPYITFSILGVYGVGFVAAALAACVLFSRSRRLSVAIFLTALVLLEWAPRHGGSSRDAHDLRVAGIQAEIPSPAAVLENLNLLASRCPDTPLYVLSEYTFDGPVPAPVKEWCRAHGKYLVVGGKDPAPGDRYYNTAFVVDPTGAIVFGQAKSVPIQFFDDGLPAAGQQLWSSPWGKIGLCICYDLSYRQVTDRLVALGAQALIVPTMDAESWGAREHTLHTRIAPVRASEYGIPVFRVASSGISQAVAADGRELTRAPFPGNAATLSARFALGAAGRLPFDRFLVPVSLFVTAAFLLFLPLAWIWRMLIKSEKRPG